ncbi:MAG: S8 family serine peptidase [Myxococcota bacterium]
MARTLAALPERVTAFAEPAIQAMARTVSSLVLVIALIGANPDWPARDTGLSAEDLSSPALWPDDPGYAPGPDCRGQWGLFSFVPACAGAAVDRTGAQVDRAWLWTTGRPDVIIAVANDGINPSERDLITQWRLNARELQPPAGADVHDVNGDGAFDVRDYTTATGTETPTIDRVFALDLLQRPDRGDANGNGLLDPQDILQIYADGRDDDGNGYIDDICGWDFVDDDPDPFVEDAQPAIDATRAALARANDGVGVAGVCPRCRGLPLRVSRSGASTPMALALAVLHAVDHEARVVMIDAAAWGDRPELHAAADYANARRSVVMVGAGRTGGARAPTTWPADRVLRVGSIGPDNTNFARAQRFDAKDACSSSEVSLTAPGRCDDIGLGIVAGVAGLVWTAAAGLEDRDVAPWPSPPSASTVRGLLLAQAKTLTVGKASTLGLPSTRPSPASPRLWRTSRIHPTLPLSILLARRLSNFARAFRKTDKRR